MVLRHAGTTTFDMVVVSVFLSNNLIWFPLKQQGNCLFTRILILLGVSLCRISSGIALIHHLWGFPLEEFLLVFFVLLFFVFLQKHGKRLQLPGLGCRKGPYVRCGRGSSPGRRPSSARRSPGAESRSDAPDRSKAKVSAGIRGRAALFKSR